MRAAAVLIVAAVLAGCTTTKEPVAAGACDAGKASGFVGRKADAAVAEQARVAAGADRVRVLTPDMIVTMEYMAGRLSLSVDAAGVVKEVRCG